MESIFKSQSQLEEVPAFGAAADFRGKGVFHPPLVPTTRGGSAPLSFAQERLWFLDQINPGDCSSNISRAVSISGSLEEALLQQSLQEIVDRHESLRTTFATTQLYAGIDSKPMQLVAQSRKLELPVIDLSQETLEQRDGKARDLARVEAQRPFDLTLGPLMRATLVKLELQQHILLIVVHRIVSDECSLEVFFRELWQIYGARKLGDRFPLPQLPIQYSDYSAWQREYVGGETVKTAIGYWREKLHGSPTAIELPTNRLKPVQQTWRGNFVSIVLEKRLVEVLRTVSARESSTLSMSLLTAFNVLLSRYSRQRDVVVGSIIANRDSEELKGLIGPLSNLLTIRTDLSGNPTFIELLARVRQVALEAEDAGCVPFEKLLDELKVERSLSHAPLLQVTFNMEAQRNPRNDTAGLSIEDFNFDDEISRFELTLVIVESADRLVCRFGYNSGLFDAETVERMSGHFKVLLESIASNPNQRVSALPLLGEPERNQLLVDWNNTKVKLGPANSIPQLFEAQVERTPGATALIFAEQHLSYGELNRRANRLAHYLRGLGVGPESKVGICIGRSTEMALGVLAVLKAGGAYVPLDPAYPRERLSFMIDDAQSSVLLADEKSAVNLPDGQSKVLFLDKDWDRFDNESERNPGIKIDAKNLGYVIYTSGSTGQPKGVAMPHHALVNLVSWQIAGAYKPSRTLQFASLSFDVSFQEMFSTWCSGGTVFLITENLRKDTRALLHFIEDHRIERIFLPFVFLQHLAEVIEDGEPVPSHLREIVTAGEQLEITPQISRMCTALGDVALHNHYGPSETHVVTAYELDRQTSEWTRLPPIGRPIANTAIYVLDEHSEIVPIGVAGELCIGGAGISRGYINRPALTAEKYLPDPFALEPGSRIYRTGDLARRLPDGNLEFLGRIDNQVKIRGYRIELGEVEATLREHPSVRDVAVVARQGRLVTYVVASHPRVGNGTNFGELRSFLKTKLPDYMSPAMFIELDALPLTPNGKVDRRALPESDEARVGLPQQCVPPRDELEKQLAGLWQKVLQRKEIGVADDFFELGGDSLLAARLFAQIHNRFGKHLPLATLFLAPTIEQLANALRKSESEKAWSSLVAIQPQGSKPPLFCVHAAGANVLIYRPLSRHLGDDQPVYALQAQGLDGRRQPYASVEDMAAYYIREMREFQPDGPYYLLGASFGGLVIFEMAQQLLDQGQKVAFLAMLNTNCPVYTLTKRMRCHLGHLAQRGPKVYAQELSKSLKRRLKLTLVEANNTDTELQRLVEGRQDDDALVRTVVAILDAEKEYAPARTLYPGRITLFWANDAPRDFEDNRLAWQKLATGGLDVHVVPGTHTSMREEPHVRALVEKLTPCLNKAQSAILKNSN